jgi:hypothetical protein
MIGRWALKWWPDTRAMVEDLVGNAPSNHGTQSARQLCRSSCPPAYWQQRDDAKFIEALNSGGETFAGIDYTVNYTRYDEVVTPNADEQTGSSPLRTGDGRIRNTLIQDVCPNDTAEHLVLGSYDPVGWALALDALTHDGPADPARIDPAVCSEPFMPGVNPATFPADWARYTATIGEAAAQSEYVTEEPPLRTPPEPSSPPVATGQDGARRACASRRRFTIRLDRRLRRARVTVAGRRAKVRRRRGRLTAVVDLRGKPRGRYRVRIRGVTRSGRVIRSTRRYRTC